MPRRRYDQACSLASALDRIGERWSLLIVRELLLGPLRFSDLARSRRRRSDATSSPAACAISRPTGSSRRRELEPPAAGTVYELTELGRGSSGR